MPWAPGCRDATGFSRSWNRSFSNGAGRQDAREDLRVFRIGGVDCGRARKSPQARDDAYLEGQKRHQLRQGHDIRRRPAGIEQLLQGGRARIPRMEDEQMRMLERRGEPLSEALPVVRGDLVDGPLLVLDRERTLRI